MKHLIFIIARRYRYMFNLAIFGMSHHFVRINLHKKYESGLFTVLSVS